MCTRWGWVCTGLRGVEKVGVYSGVVIVIVGERQRREGFHEGLNAD